MDEKIIGTTLSEQNRVNVRMAAAFLNSTPAEFIRSTVKTELNKMQIQLPGDPVK